MIDPKIPRARSGPSLVAGVINRFREVVDRQSRQRPGTGLASISTPSGNLPYSTAQRNFHARLSGNACPYSYTEVYGVLTSARWADLPGGRTGDDAWELNNTIGLSGNVVDLHNVDGGSGVDWKWFQWRSLGTKGGGGYTPVNIPGCTCTAMPEYLNMTSADPTCNFDMYQNCTIAYGPTPSGFLPTSIGDYSYLSTVGFPDPVADGAIFYYYFNCQYNLFTLSRIYLESPYGSPYRDGVLYSWTIGITGNTCAPFRLDNGSAFPGSDASCFVTIEG